MAEKSRRKRRICHDAYEEEYSGRPGWMGTYTMPGMRMRMLEDSAAFSSASAGSHRLMYGVRHAERDGGKFRKKQVRRVIMECVACGRQLRDPQSMERGYGPVCYRKTFGAARPRGGKQPSANWMQSYEVPGQINIDEYLQSVADK